LTQTYRLTFVVLFKDLCLAFVLLFKTQAYFNHI
jgi:hypothetical protein